MAYTQCIAVKKGTRHRGFHKAADGRYKSAGTYSTEERALEVAEEAEKLALETAEKPVTGSTHTASAERDVHRQRLASLPVGAYRERHEHDEDPGQPRDALPQVRLRPGRRAPARASCRSRR